MIRQLAALEVALSSHMPRRGWKIAINTPEVLSSLGLHHPCLGWLDGHRLYRTGDTVSAEDGQRLHAEPELCILLADSVSPQLAPAEALARIRSVAPAIELVDYGQPAADLDAVVSMSAFHAGFVVGEWQPAELASRLGHGFPVLTVPGEVSPTPRSDLVPAHLGELVRFVALFLQAYGWTLEAGDLILSGSYAAEAVVLHPGSSATADFGLLGSVHAQISA